MDQAHFDQLRAVLRHRDDYVDRLDPGLSDAEIEAAQSQFDFTFPPDLRQVLQVMLPMGRGWPNWRNPSDPGIQSAFDWPLEGIQFDVEHNDFWWGEWGVRPSNPQSRLERLQQAIKAAPRLIPIHYHRYIPSDPLEAGNPVFSVYQTDIILFGTNLADYWGREFGGRLNEPMTLPSKRIRLWSDLCDDNGPP